jgi:hypothetical protein
MRSKARSRAAKTSRRRRTRTLLQAILATPPAIQVLTCIVLVVVTWWTVNWIYQAIRKPTIMLLPVSGALSKSPPETWQEYGPLFKTHSTAVITPEFLAALAQSEGAGNPIAQTYWRRRLTWNVFELYRPASSSVGMYQITDATFLQAKRYCIHNHVLVEDGPWHDVDSCWFNSLYSRIIPSHAIELTAALLDRGVAETLRRYHLSKVSLRTKQDLAAIIHLCGAGAGDVYAARKFRLTARQQCGDHEVRAYLSRVNAMKQTFARLAAAG